MTRQNNNEPEMGETLIRLPYCAAIQPDPDLLSNGLRSQPLTVAAKLRMEGQLSLDVGLRQ